MNEYDLFEAIGNIDKKYVEEAAAAAPARKRTGRRRVWRIALVAAALAVLLLGTFVATAHIVYDVRFLQLIGLESTMKELDNGYYQIGLLKTIDDVTVSRGNMPDWFRSGVEAALKAPTATNQQKFAFGMKDGNPAVKVNGVGFYTEVDCGIVAYHFEIGSRRKVEHL